MVQILCIYNLTCSLLWRGCGPLETSPSPANIMWHHTHCNIYVKQGSQKSDNNIPWLFHDNLRCFPWCQEGKHKRSSAHIHHIYIQNESQISFKLKITSQKDALILSNITIWNLEHQPKVSHSQTTASMFTTLFFGPLFMNFPWHHFIPCFSMTGTLCKYVSSNQYVSYHVKINSLVHFGSIWITILYCKKIHFP